MVLEVGGNDKTESPLPYSVEPVKNFMSFFNFFYIVIAVDY